jgi:hypothetical protein
MLGHVSLGLVRLGQVSIVRDWLFQIRSGEVMLEHVKTCEASLVQVKTD